MTIVGAATFVEGFDINHIMTNAWVIYNDFRRIDRPTFRRLVADALCEEEEELRVFSCGLNVSSIGPTGSNMNSGTLSIKKSNPERFGQ